MPPPSTAACLMLPALQAPHLCTTLIFLLLSVCNYCCINSIRETISCVIGQLACGWGSSSSFRTNMEPNWKQECSVSPLERLNIRDPHFNPSSIFWSLSSVLYFYPLCSLHHPDFLFSSAHLLFLWSVHHVGALSLPHSLGPCLCLMSCCPNLISKV